MMSDPSFFAEATAPVPKAPLGAATKPQGQLRGILDHVWFADAKPSFGGRKLVKGWLEAEQVSLIFGPPGCGKTFFMMDLAVHVAKGDDWGGSKVRQGGVIYIAAEAGRSILNRVYAFKLHRELENVVLPFIAVTCSVDLCTKGKNDITRLTELVTAAATEMTVKPSLIIVDTVARAMAGGNENGPDDMGRFVRALDWLRDKVRCHVAVIHHVGKDRDRGARGHSSLFAAVDTAIEVECAEGVSTATIVKQRDGISNVSKSFRLLPVTVGYDEDDDPVTSCVIEWTDRPNEEPAGKNEKVFLKALEEILAQDGREDATRSRVIEEAKWREASKAAFDGKPDSFRNAFLRVSRKLSIRTGPVGFAGGLVWIKKQAELAVDAEPF
jgi:AAA domain-containing protein